MKFSRTIFLLAIIILLNCITYSQSRIRYNNQDLFLSGANLAWVAFANDFGPRETAYDSFAEAMLAMHDNGGNAMRVWMHTNGSASPEFNSQGFVISPGEGTMEDLKTILDLAWDREIGIKLCLWSFDMLRSSNDPAILTRNRKMLEDTAYTMAYINNSLIPMVDSVKGHPAIIAWEIFNEPEGMSNEFGWSEISHVPMSLIQRFINLCSGAIHRTDTSAQVTSGAWSFAALTDVPTASLGKSVDISEISETEKQEIENSFNKRYRMSLTAEEIISHIQKVSAANMNYYSDDRLIASGGDIDGILDFYSVHFYSGLGSQFSPFLKPASFWNLDKPILVAEFAMSESHNNIPKEEMFKHLYETGYAGALAWSWSDDELSSHANMLSAMKYMWDNYRNDVDINGISGDWPLIQVTSPVNNTTFPENSDITIEAQASDSDGSVVLVEFFASNTLKVGERDTLPYTITWNDAPRGSYTLKAVATDDSGNQRISNLVKITVGTPLYVKYEAEGSNWQGTGMSILNNAGASGGRYLEMRTNVGTVTWMVPGVKNPGSYEVKIGYRLSFDRPKSQFINVNSQRVTELTFDSTLNVWLEKPFTIDLIQGFNTVQMELSWGWMDLDYLALPIEAVTAVEEETATPIAFLLEQNYPNPFNPETNFGFRISNFGLVSLKVYDILGNEIVTIVNEELPAGNYNYTWNASGFASGVYFYKLQAGEYTATKKMILLK